MVTRKRGVETGIYIGLWVLVAGLYLLDVVRERSYTTMPLIDGVVLRQAAVCLLPYLTLFLINNLVLIPRLLFRDRYVIYLCSAVCAVLAVWFLQNELFRFYEELRHVQFDHPRPHHGLHHGPHPLLPMPMMLSLVYDMLIVGANLAIALIFQRMEALIEQQRLQKANAEERLAYLKAQINPHFYMNMLNNIHGMIDIDTEKAQDMVIAMSKLMRYMLYDSSRPHIDLSEEIAFLRNYLDLMRQRYPSDKVRISADLPPDRDISGVMVAPLLFLVFIENAFKHGISYREESFVAVRIAVDGESVSFTCLNSRHQGRRSGEPHGIGLHNVESRLNLIYGNRYHLETVSDGPVYRVNLTIPVYEIAHSDY